VEAAIAAAAKTFESLGAIVEEDDPDIGGDPITLWDAFWWPSMRYTFESLDARWREQADSALVSAVDSRHPVSVSDHLRAQLQRADIHNAFVRFHQRYDLLITPSVPLPAFEAGALVPPSGEWGRAWTDWSPFSYPFNLTTQPAASVPCGLSAAGLPIGLQVVGPIGGDAMVLRAARALEEAVPFRTLDAPRTGTA
jgi:aspartyl-tRNA(Asn)/glutamyl-tRNA(Gln) amidotransferase subunit A